VRAAAVRIEATAAATSNTSDAGMAPMWSAKGVLGSHDAQPTTARSGDALDMSPPARKSRASLARSQSVPSSLVSWPPAVNSGFSIVNGRNLLVVHSSDSRHVSTLPVLFQIGRYRAQSGVVNKMVNPIGYWVNHMVTITEDPSPARSRNPENRKECVYLKI
jgi:hypothetical protein